MAGYKDNNRRGGLNLGFWSKQLRKISNFGLNYDTETADQSYAIGINDDPQSATSNNVQNGPYMYDLFAKKIISKILDQKSIAYLDRSYYDKRKILRQYSIKDEIRGFITEIADEAIIYDQDNRFCKVTDLPEDFDNTIRQKVHENFDRIYNSLGFADGITAWSHFKDLIIDGFIAFEIIFDKKQKNVVDLMKIDPLTLVPATDPDSGTVVWVQYPDDPRLRRILLDAQIIYISYGNNQDIGETSYVEPLIRPYNQLKLLEQTKILYNINQAAIYKKFIIPVGGMSRQQAEQQLSTLMSEYHEDVQWQDDLGTVTINGSSNIPHSKDYWFPQSSEGTPEMSIETPTGNDLNEDGMLTWFHNNLTRESKIPYTRMDKENGGGNIFGEMTEMSRDEVKFHNYIRRIRTVFREILTKPLKIQMMRDFPELISDYRFMSCMNIEYNSNEPLEEWNYLKNFEKRSGIAASLLSNLNDAEGKPFLAIEWVMRKVMKFTDQDFDENAKYKLKEAGTLGTDQEGGNDNEDFVPSDGPGGDYFKGDTSDNSGGSQEEAPSEEPMDGTPPEEPSAQAPTDATQAQAPPQTQA